MLSPLPPQLLSNQPSSPAYNNARIKILFSGDFIRQDKVIYNHGPIVNIYIVYRYSGYGIGFDSRGTFSHPSGGFGKNVIIFGVDVSSSVHANNKTRNILVLGKDFIQGIDDTTIYAEKIYSTSFTVANKKIV